jgi:hypothetical protein
MSRRKSREQRSLFERVRLWLEIIGLATTLYALNWCVQVLRKPSELAGAISPKASKFPDATWKAYGPLFERYATNIVTPELLAALAQVESSGNPTARTYWRWRLTANPLRIFSPASSGVGLYQITDGSFQRCRSLCVHSGQVEHEREWYDPRGCWFNAFYNRLVPDDAVELVSACLSDDVDAQLNMMGSAKLSLESQQDLAAISHLCGPRSPEVEKLRRGLPIPKGWKCGEHDAHGYLSRVRGLRRTFAAMRSTARS